MSKPSTGQQVLDAIAAREKAAAKLIAFEVENAKMVTDYVNLFNAQRTAEDRVKSAIVAAASLQPNVRRGEFAGVYKYTRPEMRKTDFAKLYRLNPAFVKDHPDVVTVKPAELDNLVDSGQLDANIRNQVVTTEFGSPRVTIPPYKR